MELICLDTHILIWAIKEQSTQGQEDMIKKAKAFLSYIDKHDIKALIPSIVLAEILMSIPVNTHRLVTNLIQKSFIVSPFDIQASEHFAKIWRDSKENKIIEDLTKNHNAKREELKSDCMIAATALCKNAKTLYTHDKKLTKIAEPHISVSEIPVITEQIELFSS